jgi:hypothetical protein
MQYFPDSWPGDIADWVDFETGEFNVSGMKDHMFYHSGMLRGSFQYPIKTCADHFTNPQQSAILCPQQESRTREGGCCRIGL